jgi:glutaredoxin-dependent peroxiredoxin
MPITVGQQAPTFTLFDSEKKPISLQDYKGKNVVLLFFPLAFTSVCTRELCGIRDNIAQYNGFDAQVFGISTDSLFTLAKFKEEQQLNFPLLSDYNKEVSAAYDSLYETFPSFNMKGVSKRSAFVIDREGKIVYSEICATPGDEPNYEAIKQALTASK